MAKDRRAAGPLRSEGVEETGWVERVTSACQMAAQADRSEGIEETGWVERMLLLARSVLPRKSEGIEETR